MLTELEDGSGRGIPGATRLLVLSGLYPKPGSLLSGGFIHRQVVELRALGVDARVLCPVARSALPFHSAGTFAGGLDDPRDDHLDGVPVRYVPYAHVPHRLSTRLEAASLVRHLEDEFDEVFEGDADLVHGHWLYPAGYAAVELASRRNLPVVVSARGSDVHRYPRESRGVARFSRDVLRRADVIVAVSRALEREIRKLGGDAANVTVVHNGVDVERFHTNTTKVEARERVGLPEAGTFVCSVGRLVEEKGVRELVEAFRAVAVARGDLYLVLVGDGPMCEELAALARASGLEDRVMLPGEVPHDVVADWLRACDVLVHASHAEGLPNVVLEAMACGLPVVATDVGGTPEVVDDSVGRLVPAGDSERLAEALDGLLDDPAGRREMGAAAAERMRESFTWRRSAEALIDVYGAALDAAKPVVDAGTGG